MYEENNNAFALKDLVLKILFAVLVIFIIIWLFPTKGYIDKAINQKLGTSNGQVFNTNANIMKEAALGYFNGTRLPEKEGDTKKLTLKQMLDEKLLVSFTDGNGKHCNNNKSYVEIVKNEEDYKMKVNLNCTDKKAYVVSYIACTDGVCSKKKLTEENTSEQVAEKSVTEEKSSTKQTTNTVNVAKSVSVAKPKQATKRGYYTNYGSWSAWTTNKVTGSDTRQVETKTERVQIGTTKVQNGTTLVEFYPRKLTYSNGAVIYVCDANYVNEGRYMKLTMCKRSVPRYETKPVYSNVTYYRYRDRSYIN